MLNIPEAVKQLFKSGESQNYSMSINVGTTKYFTNTLYTIPEENIKGESAELRETLFSGNNPKFGTIQTSQFTVSLLNFNLLLKGKYIRVFLHYGPALNIIPYGEFYVESVEKAPYSSETKLICYDYSYFLNVQAANKIRRIPTATASTAISMCEAIFDKLHLQYTPFTSSTTYNYVTKIPDNTTYGNMLEWMGELYGGWWKPDRYGVFRFVQIGSSASPESIDTFRPKAGDHETSQIPDFTGIIFNSLLRLEETKEQDYLYGSDDGLVYTMDKSNPYIVNYNESQLNTLGQTLLPIYNSIKYIPNKIKIDGRPYLECGDWYTYMTDDDTEDQLQITAPVIQSIISGIGALNQTLQAVGQSQTTGTLDGTEYNQSSERTAIKDTQTVVSTGSVGGNKIYTRKSAPNNTLGNEGDLWVKYHTENNDKFINSNNEEIDVDIPRYESDNDALSYVDTTIRPILRTIKDTSASQLSDIVKQFEKECTVVLYQRYFSSSAPGGAITTSQFPQLVIDTYTVNNQSVSVIQGDTILDSGGTTVTSRAIGSNKSAIVNVDDFDGTLAEDGGNWYVIYDYLYYNTTTKYLNVIHGYLDINWYFHTLPHDTLNTVVTNYSIDLVDTSVMIIDELYCKINGKWTLYDESGSGSSAVNTTYDNTTSGLAASNVQSAIDEIAQDFQDGCDIITQAVTAKGQTPASNSPADIAYAISRIPTDYPRLQKVYSAYTDPIETTIITDAGQYFVIAVMTSKPGVTTSSTDIVYFNGETTGRQTAFYIINCKAGDTISIKINNFSGNAYRGTAACILRNVGATVTSAVQDWKVFKFDSTATMGKVLSLNTIYLCVGGSCGEQHSSSFDVTANLGSYYNSNCQESGINVSVINALSGTVNISQSQFGNIAGGATVSGYILTV